MSHQPTSKKATLKPVLVGFAVGLVIFAVFVAVVMLAGGK